MSAGVVLAALLAFATLMGWARLAFWQGRAAPDARSSGGRLAALLALQPLCAALLYLTLMPPRLASPSGTLLVATRNAPPTAALALGERLIALPEAPTPPGAAHAPDLATALRTQDAARLRILGDGLEPRDREAALGRAIAFDPGPPRKGIVRLDPPKRVAPGAAFAVGGQVAGVSGGSVELVDPAGRRVDSAALSGGFTLRGTARVAGLALFKLRVLDSRRGEVEAADVPVWTAAEPPPRMLLVAGAPGPEVKYLRRWATDAGIALHTQLSAGGGVQLGDTPLQLNAATLDRFDIAVLDERSWAALSGGERRALVDAVQGGLGLLLRVTGPVSPGVGRDWQALGLTVSAGATTAPAQLRADDGDEDARRARRGPGSRDRPVAINSGSPEAAVLTRRIVGRQRPDSVSAALDTASWRARGRGRVGLWTLTDSFGLVLSGDDARYAELWSETLQRLTRPQAEARAEIGGLARQGQRVTLCNLAGPPEVQAPSGQVAKLLIDPASERSACAAYWPNSPGWHLLRRSGPKADLSPLPFFVYPANGLPGVRASETRDATLRLTSGNSSRAASLKPLSSRGSPWPWFLGWLAASGLLWWLERARVGKRLGFAIDSAAAAS